MKVNKNIAISDSGFIFNPSTGDSFTANKTGMEIIKLLKEGLSVDSISLQLKASYQIDQMQAEKDLSDFILLLKSYQMIQSHE